MKTTIRRRAVVASVAAAAMWTTGICQAEGTAAPRGLDWFRNDVPTTSVQVVPPAPEVAPPAPEAVAPLPPAVAPPARSNIPARPATVMPPMPPMNPPSGGFGPSDYPSAQIYNYVLANARYTTATALFRRAENELSMLYRELDRRFERSPELVQLLGQEQEAYRRLSEVRGRALEVVLNNDRYQKLLALKHDLADRIETGRSRHDLPLDELVSLANLKLKYSVEMRSMEGDALNAEPAVKDSQDKLVAIGSRLAAVRQKHQDEVRADPELLTARRNLEDAKITRVTAEAYLRGSMIAGDAALNGFYYARTPYKGYYPNSYDPYGYGRYARY